MVVEVRRVDGCGLYQSRPIGGVPGRTITSERKNSRPDEIGSGSLPWHLRSDALQRQGKLGDAAVSSGVSKVNTPPPMRAVAAVGMSTDGFLYQTMTQARQ